MCWQISFLSLASVQIIRIIFEIFIFFEVIIDVDLIL